MRMTTRYTPSITTPPWQWGGQAPIRSSLSWVFLLELPVPFPPTEGGGAKADSSVMSLASSSSGNTRRQAVFFLLVPGDPNIPSRFRFLTFELGSFISFFELGGIANNHGPS